MTEHEPATPPGASLEVVSVRRDADIVERVLDDGLIVYDLRNQCAHVLNRSAAAVWTLCDGRRTTDDITAIVGSAYGAAVEIVTQDVHAMLNDLRATQLLAT